MAEVGVYRVLEGLVQLATHRLFRLLHHRARGYARLQIMDLAFGLVHRGGATALASCEVAAPLDGFVQHGALTHCPARLTQPLLGFIDVIVLNCECWVDRGHRLRVDHVGARLANGEV